MMIAIIQLISWVAFFAECIWLLATIICYMNDTHGESFFEYLRENKK